MGLQCPRFPFEAELWRQAKEARLQVPAADVDQAGPHFYRLSAAGLESFLQELELAMVGVHLCPSFWHHLLLLCRRRCRAVCVRLPEALELRSEPRLLLQGAPSAAVWCTPDAVHSALHPRRRKCMPHSNPLRATRCSPSSPQLLRLVHSLLPATAHPARPAQAAVLWS